MNQVTSEKDYLFKKGKTYQFGEARISVITSKMGAVVILVKVI